MTVKFFLFMFIGMLLSCGTTPDFDSSLADPSLSPEAVIKEPELHRGKLALWGGIILQTQNLKTTTQIEVLAYPLDDDNEPLIKNMPLGRFIIDHKGFLEPMIYAQGRTITVMGTISEVKQALVGASTLSYPVLSARQLHLWPAYDKRSRSTFHFGIGIEL